MIESLRRILKGRVCVLGVGNRIRGDDAVGSLLIDRVSPRSSFECVDAGCAPENHLERVVRYNPDTLLIVDAVDFDGRPGELRLFSHNDIGEGGLSTHALSLGMTCDYIRARGCLCQVHLLGIQPADTGLDQPLSPAVREALESLHGLLCSV